MKHHIYLLLYFSFIVHLLNGQEFQSIDISQAGQLHTLVKKPSLVSNLYISGKIDARDFFFLRDSCSNLQTLNLSDATIEAYEEYPADRIPKFALTRVANTENWLDLRLSSPYQEMIPPTDTLSILKRTFRIDKRTDLNTVTLTARLPEGALITPNPSDIEIKDGKMITFTVTSESGEKRMYQYYITLDNWFTAIICGDAEFNMRGNDSTKICQYVEKVLHLNENSYRYTSHSYLKPTTGLFIMAGDMDKDRGGNLSDFDSVFKRVTDAGIPLITLYGNHDWEPDYWDDGSVGYSLLSGLPSNKRSLNVVNTYLERSKTLGIEDVHVFTSTHEQVSPFTFRFRGIRFYIGQTYWFQPPYTSSLFGASTFYAPDEEIILPLENHIENSWKEDPAVWVQHYPLTCEDRWWLHQNGSGKSQDSNLGNWTTASAKRTKLKELIRKTNNPAFFAGHTHSEATYTHSDALPSFKEYISGYFAKGKAWMVLMREGKGVMEVKSIQL